MLEDLLALLRIVASARNMQTELHDVGDAAGRIQPRTRPPDGDKLSARRP